MKKLGASYTMAEWESLCERGNAYETEGQSYPVRIPIECPNILDYNSVTNHPRQCKNKLEDTGEIEVVGHMFRHKVECTLCGWKGTRSIGKEKG